MTDSRAVALARSLAVPVSVLALYETWFRLSRQDSDTLAPPSAAFTAFLEAVRDGSLLAATAGTFASLTLGLVIGGGLGLLAGLVVGFSRRADDTSFLSIEMLRPIPSVALLPLALMIFGFGYRMEIFVVAFATFWPFLILSQSAVRQVEPRLIEVSRLLGLSPLAAARNIVLPAAAPRLMTALRLGTGIALIVAVTCEIASNPQGLGHALMLSQETLRPARMWAFLFWIGAIGLALNLGLLALERKLFAHRGDYDATVAT